MYTICVELFSGKNTLCITFTFTNALYLTLNSLNRARERERLYDDTDGLNWTRCSWADSPPLQVMLPLQTKKGELTIDYKAKFIREYMY